MTSTRRVAVWRALLDGDCKQIAGSQESLIRFLHETNGWYRPEEDARWTRESSDEDVPVASGKRFDCVDDAGRIYPHVAWDCPHCGKHHTTDVDPGDESPHLWFCEFGKGIVLVIE